MKAIFLLTSLVAVSGVKAAEPSTKPGGLYQALIAKAGICFPQAGNVDSPSDYMLAVVSAIGEVKGALTLVGKTQKEPGDGMIAITTALEQMGCSLQHIDAYMKSTNKLIGKSATVIALGVCEVSEQYQQQFALIKDILNGEADTRPGTMAERHANANAVYKEAYTNIFTGVMASAHAVVVSPGHLSITSAQRDLMLHSLRKTFGAGLKKPDSYIDSSAQMLAKFLGEKWKLADQK